MSRRDEAAREQIEDAILVLAEEGWSAERIRQEVDYLIGVARDEGAWEDS